MESKNLFYFENDDFTFVEYDDENEKNTEINTNTNADTYADTDTDNDDENDTDTEIDNENENNKYINQKLDNLNENQIIYIGNDNNDDDDNDDSDIASSINICSHNLRSSSPELRRNYPDLLPNLFNNFSNDYENVSDNTDNIMQFLIGKSFIDNDNDDDTYNDKICFDFSESNIDSIKVSCIFSCFMIYGSLLYYFCA